MNLDTVDVVVLSSLHSTFLCVAPQGYCWESNTTFFQAFIIRKCGLEGFCFLYTIPYSSYLVWFGSGRSWVQVVADGRARISMGYCVRAMLCGFWCNSMESTLSWPWWSVEGTLPRDVRLWHSRSHVLSWQAPIFVSRLLQTFAYHKTMRYNLLTIWGLSRDHESLTSSQDPLLLSYSRMLWCASCKVCLVLTATSFDSIIFGLGALETRSQPFFDKYCRWCRSQLDKDEVDSVAALLGDLVAYRAKGASHLEVVAGKSQLLRICCYFRRTNFIAHQIWSC